MPRSSRPSKKRWRPARISLLPPNKSSRRLRTPSMNTAIELHKVSKIYPGKKALDSLSLSVPAGSIFALLGDNGAGKSTTIRILNGLTPCDTGYARVLGRDAWQHASELRQRIGYVPERPKFYD